MARLVFLALSSAFFLFFCSSAEIDTISVSSREAKQFHRSFILRTLCDVFGSAKWRALAPLVNFPYPCFSSVNPHLRNKEIHPALWEGCYGHMRSKARSRLRTWCQYNCPVMTVAKSIRYVSRQDQVAEVKHHPGVHLYLS